MPRPYSADLRERVLLAGEAGLPPTEVARRFGIGLATVYLWRQQARAEGRRCAKPHGGGRARGIDTAGGGVFQAVAGERHDRTLGGYRELLAVRSGGPQVSRPTLCRALRRLGLRRKKTRLAKLTGIVAVRGWPGRHPGRDETGCAGFARAVAAQDGGADPSTPRGWPTPARACR